MRLPGGAGGRRLGSSPAGHERGGRSTLRRAVYVIEQREEGQTGARLELPLLLLVPMRLERVAVRAPAARLVPVGVGPRRAAAAASRARQTPAAAVAVAGYCGALTDDLLPGDVVVATELRVDEADAHGSRPVKPALPIPSADELVAALRAGGVERVHAGPIISVPRLVHGHGRARLAATGAIAADMESAWLAEAAAGRPFAVLRVVVDVPGSSRRPAMAVHGWQLAHRALRRATPALAEWTRVVAGPR